jgi:hypothetical protein
MAQKEECLPSKHEILSSKTPMPKNKKTNQTKNQLKTMEVSLGWWDEG